MSWPSIRLAELSKVITKGTTPTTIGFDFSDHGVHFLRVQNIEGGSVNYTRDTLFIDQRTHQALSRSHIHPGDVLVSIAGTIGRTGVVPEDAPPLNCNQAIAIVRTNGELFRPYLRHWIEGLDAQRQMRGAMVTGTISNLSLAQVGNLQVPVPPFEEQRRIAEVLDRAEALRTKRRTAIAQLDTLAHAIFLDLFGDPVANPMKFPRKTLGEIIEFVGGSQPPRETFTYEESPETIRLVQIRDFKSDDFKTYIPRKLAKRSFAQDDVMIGRYGPPVFQILRGLSGSYNVALMKAMPRDGVTKDFIFHLLREERLHSFVVARSERTAGQSGVNLDLLEKYPAYLPPFSLQREFSDRVRAADKLTAAHRSSLAQMETLFSALEYRAFRGEL